MIESVLDSFHKVSCILNRCKNLQLLLVFIITTSGTCYKGTPIHMYHIRTTMLTCIIMCGIIGIVQFWLYRKQNNLDKQLIELNKKGSKNDNRKQ